MVIVALADGGRRGLGSKSRGNITSDCGSGLTKMWGIVNQLNVTEWAPYPERSAMGASNVGFVLTASKCGTESPADFGASLRSAS